MNHKQDQTFSPPTLFFSFSHLHVFCVSIIMLVTLLKVYRRWWITQGQTGSRIFSPSLSHSLWFSSFTLLVCVSQKPTQCFKSRGRDSLCLLMRKGKDESGEEGVETWGPGGGGCTSTYLQYTQRQTNVKSVLTETKWGWWAEWRQVGGGWEHPLTRWE